MTQLDRLTEAARLVQARAVVTVGGGAKQKPATNGRPPQATSRAVKPLARRISEVKAESVRWLSPGRIPFGKITILEGDPNLGKSTILLDLAARVTRGEAFPEDPPLRWPAAVVLLSAEDGVADTIRPRLEAAGADLDQVHVLEGFVREDGRTGEIVLPDTDSLAALERLIEDEGAELVIVDVLTAFLSGSVEAFKDHDIRRALRPLKELAERTGVAIILVRHLRKSVGGKAIAAGGGSMGIGGAARSVLLVDRDPENSEIRVLASVKCNLAAAPRSLTYRIEGTPSGASRIAWLGVSEHTAESLTEARASEEGEAGQRSKIEECADCLRDWLTPNGMERREVLKLGHHAGFSESTVDRARRLLRVVHKSTGAGASKRSWWSLPSIPSEKPNSVRVSGIEGPDGNGGG